MEKTTRQNMDLRSVLPKTMVTNSAKGLRSDMRPRLPTEMLMKRKRESLQEDFASKETGSRAEKGLWIRRRADSVARETATTRSQRWPRRTEKVGSQQQNAFFTPLLSFSHDPSHRCDRSVVSLGGRKISLARQFIYLLHYVFMYLGSDCHHPSLQN